MCGAYVTTITVRQPYSAASRRKACPSPLVVCGPAVTQRSVIPTGGDAHAFRIHSPCVPAPTDHTTVGAHPCWASSNPNGYLLAPSPPRTRIASAGLSASTCGATYTGQPPNMAAPKLTDIAMIVRATWRTSRFFRCSTRRPVSPQSTMSSRRAINHCLMLVLCPQIRNLLNLFAVVVRHVRPLPRT